jgi:hypothetical protein
MDYTLKLTQQDVQTVINALGELPLKMSANVFGIIHKQVQEQDEANAIPLQDVKLGE